jgi:hypothetical protein
MPRTERIEINMDELIAIVVQARSAPLSAEDFEKLKAALETLGYVTGELEKKGASIRRLRKLIFGATTEKTSAIFGKDDGDDNEAGGSDPEEEANAGSQGDDELSSDQGDKKDKRKRPGHGRNGADAYRGAETIEVPHETLASGDACPECAKGKVYEQAKPGVIVRVTGQAPLHARVYKLDKLRCNLCGQVFTARPPDGVGEKKYDETAASMIALLKYGNGMPFNRLRGLQDSLGIPLPASTQWDIVSAVAEKLRPVRDELIRCAAQGEVLYNDDTNMKILELMKRRKEAEAADEDPPERTGVFTTGIVSTNAGRTIALFFTGNQHAGENLEDVLEKRAKALGPPIQMSDGLSRNLPATFETIVANCNLHARRRFVDVVENFPGKCRHVLDVFRELYKNDAYAREQNMSPKERLDYHRAESGPLMDGFKKWMTDQIAQKKVEPNSGLGDAIAYTKKHWVELTKFLEVPGAPLDNNICERALKKAILHRKNALFYKTENGAVVGDIFMSLIYTCLLSDANPFDYLTELQRHAEELLQYPEQWMPWNYRDALTRSRAA